MTDLTHRPPKQKVMGEGLSLYLDVVRLATAQAVVIYHGTRTFQPKRG
jgi:hypothetical protein